MLAVGKVWIKADKPIHLFSFKNKGYMLETITRDQLRSTVHEMVLAADEFNFTESQIFKHIDHILEVWNTVVDVSLEDLVQEMTVDYRENYYLSLGHC